MALPNSSASSCSTSRVASPGPLDQIDPLVQARELLDVARRKRTILGTSRSRNGTRGVGHIQRARHHRHRRGARLPEQSAAAPPGRKSLTLDDQIAQPDGDLNSLTAQHDQLRAGHSNLLSRISTSTGDLAPLQEQLAAAQKFAGEVAIKRTNYEHRIAALGFELPDDGGQFWELRDQLMDDATRIDSQLRGGQGCTVRRNPRPRGRRPRPA